MTAHIQAVHGACYIVMSHIYISLYKSEQGNHCTYICCARKQLNSNVWTLIPHSINRRRYITAHIHAVHGTSYIVLSHIYI